MNGTVGLLTGQFSTIVASSKFPATLCQTHILTEAPQNQTSSTLMPLFVFISLFWLLFWGTCRIKSIMGIFVSRTWCKTWKHRSAHLFHVPCLMHLQKEFKGRHQHTILTAVQQLAGRSANTEQYVSSAIEWNNVLVFQIAFDFTCFCSSSHFSDWIVFWKAFTSVFTDTNSQLKVILLKPDKHAVSWESVFSPLMNYSARIWNAFCGFRTNHHFSPAFQSCTAEGTCRNTQRKSRKGATVPSTCQVSTFYQQGISCIQTVFKSFAYICGDGRPVKAQKTKAKMLFVWSCLFVTHLQQKTKVLGCRNEFLLVVLFGCVTVHPYTLFID